MSLKLYELTDSYNTILSLLESEDFKKEDLVMALEELQGAITEKADGIGKFYKALGYDIDVSKLEEQRLANRRKAMENKQNSLKQYLQFQMEKVEIDKIKTPLMTITLQNSPPTVHIIDDDLIPAKYITIIPEQRIPYKKAILDDLKAGAEVPGAEIAQGKHLRIR